MNINFVIFKSIVLEYDWNKNFFHIDVERFKLA